MGLDDQPVLEPHAAGIDIGVRKVLVAVPPDRDEHRISLSAIASRSSVKV